MANAVLMSALKQPPIRSNMPGLGLRHWRVRVDRVRAVKHRINATAQQLRG